MSASYPISPRVFGFGLLLCCCVLLSIPSPAATAGTVQSKGYGWQGDINGKIPVSIWLEVTDGLAVGELVYLNTKNRTPIRLLGTTDAEHSRLYLKEIFSDGLVTGVINAEFTDETLTGTWTAPDKIQERKDGRFAITGGKTFPISLTKSEIPAKQATWEFDPADVVGIYTYYHGDHGMYGKVVVRSTADGVVDFDVESYTAAPSFNTAIVRDQSAKLDGNQAVAVLEEGTCALSLRFYKEFMAVDFVEGQTCGQGYFGMGAYPTGVFVKIK